MLLSLQFVARLDQLDKVIAAAVEQEIPLRIENLKENGQAVVLTVVMDGIVLDVNQKVSLATQANHEEEPTWVRQLREHLAVLLNTE